MAVFDKTASNPAGPHRPRRLRCLPSRRPMSALQSACGARLTAIERGVLDGQYQTRHYSRATAAPTRWNTTLLFDEGDVAVLRQRVIRCLPRGRCRPMDWDSLRAHQFAGLGYHFAEYGNQPADTPGAPRPPALTRSAIATLILSGSYLGFFARPLRTKRLCETGPMRAIHPAVFRYACQLFRRRAPLTPAGPRDAGPAGLPAGAPPPRFMTFP